MIEMPSHIKMYIDEIAERLEHGRAIAMVGAGFSRNAEKVRNTRKSFLTWNELGDIFYEKIYRHRPDENAGHYLDALKLASMIENMFGRPVLDQILLDNLPDEEYAPSRLHKKLLQLNWADIFTTNYDTLLERAGKYVSNKRYQVVVSKEDLVYSQSPRIVKLHGSFPHSRPFIISQEDYRKYPRDSAIFVNTVQQAVIENALCLFGFSGDDPNFLNWIGWIRDNLGADKSSKIYMITADPKLMFENTFLASKNIILINMSECFNPGEVDYGEALDCFLNELLKSRRNMRRKNWTGNLSFNKDSLEELKQFWKACQADYPGWIVLPSKYRKCLEESLELFSAKWLDRLSIEPDGVEAGLYDWVRQLCLLPLSEEASRIYENIADKIKDASQRIEIKISLLTFYRQNGRTDKFGELKKQLEKEELYTPVQKRRIQCEKAWFSLYQCEYMQLDRDLSDWPDVQSDCGFELMHIRLMLETEQYQKALSALVKTLDMVRAEENGTDDLYVLSQESYILYSMKQIPQMEFLSGNSEPFWYEGNSDRGEYGRSDDLKSYGCDPENEIELFKTVLSDDGIPMSAKNDSKISAQFMNLLERIGSMYVIQPDMDLNEQVKKAILCIIKNNFYWGMALSIQTRETRFMQKAVVAGLICTKGKQADRIANHLCRQILKQKDAIKANKEMDDRKHRYKVWERYIPDIVSALMMKSSAKTIENAVSILTGLHQMQGVFSKLDHSAMQNMYYSLDGNYLRHHLGELLQFLTLAEDNGQEEELPVSYCDFMFYDLPQLSEAQVQTLTEAAAGPCHFNDISSRNKILVSAILYYLGALKDKQITDFRRKVIADIMNDARYPLDFYQFIFDLFQESDQALKDKITEKIKNRLTAEIESIIKKCRKEDNEKLMLNLSAFPKIACISQKYGIIWLPEKMLALAKGCLGDHEGCINRRRRCLLLGYIYRMAFRQQACDRQQILTGLYSRDMERFIVSVNTFYNCLKEEFSSWKLYLREIQAVLTAKILNCEAEAPFCIEMLGEIIMVCTDCIEEINKEALAGVLTMLLELETSDCFLLHMKACGAKLANDIHAAFCKVNGVGDILEQWKSLCTDTDKQIEHVFIRKQWGTRHQFYMIPLP